MITILIIAAAVLIISLWRMEYGIGAIILLWPAYLIRTSIIGIPTTALEMSLYALLLAYVINALRYKQWNWPQLPRWFWWLLGAWVVAWILATIFSIDRQASLGAFKAWLIDPLIFGFIIVTTGRDEIKRKIFIQAVVLSGTVVALAGLAQMIWWRETLQDGRLSSFFHPVANYAAMYLGPILIIAAGALLYKFINRWWWAAAAVMALALLLTVSFGGYLATAAAALVLWSYWPNKKVKWLTLIVGLVVALMGVMVLTQTRYFSEHFNSSDRSSAQVRQQIWGSSVRIIRDHPWLGIGPNAFEPIYRTTVAELYWPPLEWLVSQPHNLYLALWLETGLLGVISFLGLIIFWIVAIINRMQRQPRFALPIIVVAAMTAILVHGFVDTPYFKNDLSLIFVVILILPWWRIDEKTTSTL